MEDTYKKVYLAYAKCDLFSGQFSTFTDSIFPYSQDRDGFQKHFLNHSVWILDYHCY